MKLSKSPAGRIFIILYYVVLLGADVFLMMFVILKTGSFLAGLGVCLALSVGIGILGGELEFQEHRRVKYGKYFSRQKAEKPEKVIAFPVKSSG
jgi:hypothetical protein